HDRNIDAARPDTVEVAEVEIVVEEHLRNGAGSTGIDLGLQHINVGIEVRAFRMLLRVSGDRNLDVAMLPLDAGNKLRRTAIAVRMRGVGGADAAWRIAAQRDDMADADIVIATDDIVDLAARSADAGQMTGRQQRGFSQEAG